MGRQYRFSMDTADENLFLQYLKKNNYQIYSDNTNGKPETVEQFPELLSGNGGFIFYLYKPKFGKLELRSYDEGKERIDFLVSPVIEFTRTIVRPDTKIIQFGRIWAETSYFDESGALVKKSEAFVTAYMEIRKWIQKQIKPADIHTDNYVYEKCSISKGLIKLMEEDGYRFG